jgi:hypothetical protein
MKPLRHKRTTKKVDSMGDQAKAWATVCGAEWLLKSSVEKWLRVTCPECKKLKPVREKRKA